MFPARGGCAPGFSTDRRHDDQVLADESFDHMTLAGIKRREPDLDIVAFQEVGLRDRRHLQVLERAAAGRLSPTSSS